MLLDPITNRPAIVWLSDGELTPTSDGELQDVIGSFGLQGKTEPPDGHSSHRFLRPIAKLPPSFHKTSRARYKHRAYPQITVLHADARDLRMFRDETFDFALFSYNGIDYISHEGRLCALREIHRVLKPRGYFMFSAHNLDYKHIRKLPWRERSQSNPAFLRDCLSAIVQWPRHLMMRRYELEDDTYAFVNDSASGFSFVTYYIGIDHQLSQLKSIGFGDTQAYNLNGNEVKADIDFPWIYYLRIKPT